MPFPSLDVELERINVKRRHWSWLGLVHGRSRRGKVDSWPSHAYQFNTPFSRQVVVLTVVGPARRLSRQIGLHYSVYTLLFLKVEKKNVIMLVWRTHVINCTVAR